MRIVAARLHEVRLPLVHVFQTSSHRKDHLDHILVELVDESGLTGWGEMASPADPYYCPDTTDIDWFVAWRYLIPRLLQTSWDEPAEAELSWKKIRGYEFAKAGLSGAIWDVYARRRRQSLAAALGGTRTRVKCGVSLGIEPTIDRLLEQVQQQVDAGYHRVKLKIAPGWDVEPVRAVRSAFPDHDIHVDANGAYPGDDESLGLLARLDPYHLTMIEQPFAPRDFASHARLQRRLETPICLDESVVTLDDLRTMLQMQAGRVLNIKVSRMGGLTVARRAHDLARANGIPVWCGGMHEFGVGRAANLAISSLANFTLPSDVSGSRKYYARDVITPPVVAVDGWVEVPTGAGIGFGIDRDWVEQNTLRSQDSERLEPAAQQL
ncbi:MAG: o-succinylbenzoate synthase [Pseudoclavibacter sp.]|jgi:O-succinylbenzoate synthase